MILVSPDRKPRRRRRFRRRRSVAPPPRPEVGVLLLGILVALAYLVGLLCYVIWRPEEGQTLVAITTTNMLFGRAAGMSLGYAAGMPPAFVVGINLILETIQVLLFYPMFVLSWHHLLEIRMLKRFMQRMEKSASRHMDMIQRYGIIGLMIFVWIPFWMTGPVVGCVIGYFIGLRPWVNVGVVLGGTYMAIVAWAVLLRNLHAWAAEYSGLIPAVIVMFIILVLLWRHFYAQWRKNVQRKIDHQPSPPPDEAEVE